MLWSQIYLLLDDKSHQEFVLQSQVASLEGTNSTVDDNINYNEYIYFSVAESDDSI